MKIAAVVVTYNRAALLERCLEALFSQSRPPDGVIVVDNASTDRTPELLASYQGRDHALTWIRMARNEGGAGGFARGIGEALKAGYDWMWLMDDDAEPERDALAQLVSHDPETWEVLGSAPVDGLRLSWRATPRWQSSRPIELWEALNERVEVTSHPFIGFLVSSPLVSKAGVPDASFFIGADDVEYSWRLRATGARIFLIKNSRIHHPAASGFYAGVLGRRLFILDLPPWKNYYITRNKIVAARRHLGRQWLTVTLPGTVLRLFLVLVRKEQGRVRQAKAFLAGIWDGVRGRMGIRHQKWRL